MEISRMQCVLAVDGGNTKTIALVARLDGEVLGAARGDCSDIYNAEPNEIAPEPAGAALANAERTILAALRKAEMSRADISVAVFNMAGADWPEDFVFWREAAESRELGRTIIVQNDALGILHTVSPDATGVSIVCGTGAATGARAADGREWHSSFWQLSQGSHVLGQKTLRAVYRAELGLAPQTALTQRALEIFGLSDVEAILHAITARKHERPAGYLGKLGRALMDEASKGDPVACLIVEKHGADLGDYGVVAARRVGLDGTPFNLILAGSVL